MPWWRGSWIEQKGSSVLIGPMENCRLRPLELRWRRAVLSAEQALVLTVSNDCLPPLTSRRRNDVVGPKLIFQFRRSRLAHEDHVPSSISGDP